MHHEGHAILAHTPFGHVKLCAAGCIHLTFEHATLHFSGAEEFEGMAQAVALEADALKDGEAFDLHHGWLCLSLTPRGTAEFTRLVFEGLADLAWRRGDYEFTDADLIEIRTRCAP